MMINFIYINKILTFLISFGSMQFSKDVLSVILSFLEIKELTPLRIVSKMFKSVADEISKNHIYKISTTNEKVFENKTKGLDSLNKYYKLSFEETQMLFNVSYKNLKKLSLHKNVNEYLLLHKCSNLKELVIINSAYPFINLTLPKGIKKIFCATEFDYQILLETVDLEFLHISKPAKRGSYRQPVEIFSVSFLSNCKKLNHLFLGNFLIEKDEITTEQIRDFFAIGCIINDNTFLKNNAKTLKMATMGISNKFKSSENFCYLVQLTKLSVSKDIKLDFLHLLKRLRILTVSHNKSFTDKILQDVLDNCPNIKQLYLEDTSITNVNCLENISLNELHIAQKVFDNTTVSLNHIGRLKTIKSF